MHHAVPTAAKHEQVPAVLLPLPLSHTVTLRTRRFSAKIRQCLGLPGLLLLLLLLLLPVLRLFVAEGRRGSTLTARAVNGMSIIVDLKVEASTTGSQRHVSSPFTDSCRLCGRSVSVIKHRVVLSVVLGMVWYGMKWSC